MDVVALGFKRAGQFILAKKRLFISVFAACFLTTAGVVWNYHVSLKRDQEAYSSFSVLLKQCLEHDKAEGELEKLIGKASKMHDKFSKSSIASLFLVCKADLLQRMGDLGEAARVLELAVPGIKDPLVKDLNLIKLKVLNLDISVKSDDDFMKNRALQDLEAISLNGSDSAKKIALFRLFEYHFIFGNADQAKAFGSRFLKSLNPSSSQFANEISQSYDFSQMVREVKQKMETLV